MTSLSHFYFPVVLLLGIQVSTVLIAIPLLRKLVHTQRISTRLKNWSLVLYTVINVLIVVYLFVFKEMIKLHHPFSELFEYSLIPIIALIILSMICSVCVLLWKITHNKALNTQQDSKRTFLKQLLASTAVISVPSVYGLYLERLNIETTSIRIPLQRLPQEFHGFTILQISDLHISVYTRESYLHDMVDKLNQLTADILVFTGDYVTHKSDFKYFDEAYKALSQVKSFTHKIAVLGNHDFYTDPKAIAQQLTSLGFQVLNNQHICITRRHNLYIIGLDDIIVKQDNFEQASHSIPTSACQVLLCHSPDFIKTASTKGIDLMLSGHTHGGQVNIPFIGPPIVPSKYHAQYAQGLIKEKNTHLYVNRGIGVINPPIRFNCRPEITQLILEKV